MSNATVYTRIETPVHQMGIDVLQFSVSPLVTEAAVKWLLLTDNEESPWTHILFRQPLLLSHAPLPRL